MQHPTVSALASIRRRFIGGFRTRGLRPSKYMPHIGKKERARHAGRPDGAMHSSGPIHTANLVAALTKRKPRAKRAVAP